MPRRHPRSQTATRLRDLQQRFDALFDQNPAATANNAGYCNPRVDKLAAAAQAAQLTDPAAARAAWARVDRAVTDQAPWAPAYNNSWTVFVSARVGNSQIHPTYGPLLDQMWVR